MFCFHKLKRTQDRRKLSRRISAVERTIVERSPISVKEIDVSSRVLRFAAGIRQLKKEKKQFCILYYKQENI